MTRADGYSRQEVNMPVKVRDIGRVLPMKQWIGVYEVRYMYPEDTALPREEIKTLLFYGRNMEKLPEILYRKVFKMTVEHECVILFVDPLDGSAEVTE